MPPAAARLAPEGDLPATNRLRLAIGLLVRNPAELDQLLQQLYDPASPLFRQFITPDQFAARFGPLQQDYDAVIQFARDNGLEITTLHPNRLVLSVSGTAANIGRAFGVKMRVYNHPSENRKFYAPDAEPAVPGLLPILHIEGLDNYSLPLPMARKRPADSGTVEPRLGSGPSGSYRGNDFRAAYVPGASLTGAGQNVGLLQFDGYYSSDIAAYASQIGLSPAPTLVNVPVDGGVSSPGSGNSEVALDIEMVMSMAPGSAKIYVFMAPNPSPWVDLLNAMVTNTAIKQFSCSWGGGSPNASAETIFKQMAAQGQSFFNASGDSDAFTSAIAFPADSTNITQVGGTTLSTTGPGGAYISETVWNWGLVQGSYVGSSGGVSTYYGIPGYQLGIDMTANQGSTTMRNIPDVALTGDNVYVVYNNGSTGIFGGTSCAAPLWAGFMALVNQQAAAAGRPMAGFINQAVYGLGKGANYAATFHDITVGNNFSSSSPTKYAAVAGYDLCTGWGTPAGTNLINALTLPVLVTNRAVLVSESYSPGNGAIDPGETVTVNFTLLNAGVMATANLVATLQPAGGVSNPSAAQTYGALAAGGGSATRSYTFTANAVCGATIQAMLQLQDGSASLGVAVFNLVVGSPPLAQNFDGVTAPALPAGWTTSASNSQPLWVTATTASDTSPNAAFTSGAAAVGVNELVSPVFNIISSNAQLTFRNNYNLQNGTSSGRDGGVLEIKIGVGAFTDILTAGGTFVSGGYVRSISTTRGNPLGGRQAWTGSSGGFITTVANLPAAAAGQTVRLKWRCGTDNSTASVGWYIDSVTVTDGGNYICNVQNADVAISQTASPSSVVVGSNLIYTITITNLGPLAAANVVVTNTLPAGAVFVSASPGLTYSAGRVTGSIGTLSNAVSTNVSITVQTTAAGSLTNTVLVSSATSDSTLGNNSSTLVTTALSQPHLVVAPSSLAFGYVAVGQSVTQNWSVLNSGQTTLSGSAAGAGPFTVSAPGTFTVGGGQTGSVAVAFSPLADVAYTNAIIFSSNGGSSTNSVSGIGAYPLVSSFTAAPTNGVAPLVVSFTDTSAGTITNRTFDFGDGTVTNLVSTNVSHTYTITGTNNVRLTVRGPLGSASLLRSGLIVATAVVLDTVGDGIPDWWRLKYFGSGSTTNALSCATCDPDGDSFNNLAEYIADTDPTNSLSRLVLTGVASVPGGVILSWQGGVAARQFIQSRTNLLSTNDAWMDLFTNDPPTPVFNSFTNGFGPSPTRFFRVRAVRP